MNNIALIFAGGTGQRMRTKSCPKQFLEVHGKPIIIYTLDNFEMHPMINGIVVVCLEQYIDRLKFLLEKFKLTKIQSIVPGGVTGQESIRNGVFEICRHYDLASTIVLVHDGVRPFVTDDDITKNIQVATEHGNAITSTPAIETVIVKNCDNTDNFICDRNKCFNAKAPQTFRLNELRDVHLRAVAEGYTNAIDSATLFHHYGYDLNLVQGSSSNIKITTRQDYYFMRALLEIKENDQLKLL